VNIQVNANYASLTAIASLISSRKLFWRLGSKVIRSRSRDMAPEVVSWPPRTIELTKINSENNASKPLYEPHVRDDNLIGHSVFLICLDICLHCQIFVSFLSRDKAASQTHWEESSNRDHQRQSWKVLQFLLRRTLPFCRGIPERRPGAWCRQHFWMYAVQARGGHRPG